MLWLTKPDVGSECNQVNANFKIQMPNEFTTISFRNVNINGIALLIFNKDTTSEHANTIQQQSLVFIVCMYI